MLLPNTELDGAIQVAENIRTAVLAMNPVASGTQTGRLSVSIGAATFDGKLLPVETPEQLLFTVDQRLYQAKAAGRNTIMPRQAQGEAAVVGAGGLVRQS